MIQGFESVEAGLETHYCFLKTLQNLKIDTWFEMLLPMELWAISYRPKTLLKYSSNIF